MRTDAVVGAPVGAPDARVMAGDGAEGDVRGRVGADEVERWGDNARARVVARARHSMLAGTEVANTVGRRASSRRACCRSRPRRRAVSYARCVDGRSFETSVVGERKGAVVRNSTHSISN